MSVTVTVEIPEEIAEALRSAGRDLSRTALESLAVEAYRAKRLDDTQFRRLLGLTRLQADAILKEYGVWLDYALDDTVREGEATQRIIDQQR